MAAKGTRQHVLLPKKVHSAYESIALFTVSFPRLHYNVIQRGCEAISG